jgi:hypothetical protein
MQKLRFWHSLSKFDCKQELAASSVDTYFPGFPIYLPRQQMLPLEVFGNRKPVADNFTHEWVRQRGENGSHPLIIIQSYFNFKKQSVSLRYLCIR